MEALFGYGFWNHTVLGVTFWAYDEQSIKKRNMTGKTEDWWTATMNKALQDRYHLYRNLSVRFLQKYEIRNILIIKSDKKSVHV